MTARALSQEPGRARRGGRSPPGLRPVQFIYGRAWRGRVPGAAEARRVPCGRWRTSPGASLARGSAPARSFVFLVLVLGDPGGRVGAHGARGGRLRTRAHATKVGPWGGRGGRASALSFLCAHWGRCVDWRHRHRMFGEVPGEEEKQANRSPSPWTRFAVLALASDSGWGQRAVACAVSPARDDRAGRRVGASSFRRGGAVRPAGSRGGTAAGLIH